ncbi:MAG: hypothetical protein LJE74_01230 [Proteobacteria bacterium]|jgi:hypothetical protein|nr:hypothetical protein [Pseudomonadota bacterium]MCG6934303.1 hypothetical protein [Pseudomonadota bacterium]
MSEKAKLIQEMLELQKKFIDYEHKHGVTAHDYYAADESHELYQYRERYAELADKVNTLAHEEAGSHRFY